MQTNEIKNDKNYYLFRGMIDSEVVTVGGSYVIDRSIINHQNDQCFMRDDFILQFRKVSSRTGMECQAFYLIDKYKPIGNFKKKYKINSNFSLNEIDNLKWETYNGPKLVKKREFLLEPKSGFDIYPYAHDCKLYVYRITKKVTGIIEYVGFASNLYQTMNSHLVDWRYNNCTFEILEAESFAAARITEIYFINRYNGRNNIRQKYNDEAPFVLKELDDREWLEYIPSHHKPAKLIKSKPKLIVKPFDQYAA